MQTVVIYTISNVIEIDIDYDTNISDSIIASIDDGYIALNTIKGTQFIINTMNVVGIEIQDKDKEKLSGLNTPQSL